MRCEHVRRLFGQNQKLRRNEIVGAARLSRPWLTRMRDILSGHVERGALTGLAALVAR
jgi:hypothetical protein